MHKQPLHFRMAVVIVALILSSCSFAAKSSPTPTVDSLAAFATNAAQTAFFQQTQLALTLPATATSTYTPTMTPTYTPTAPTKTQPVATAASCARYNFISETIKDNTQMAAGEAFTKTWRVENNGTCTWTTSFKLVFSSGEAMGGQTLTLANAVPVGSQVDLSVNMTTPNKTGTLTGYWFLMDDTGHVFGQSLFVKIVVGTVSPSPTGSLTATPTGPTPTKTPKPSKTPIYTPTETETEVPTATT